VTGVGAVCVHQGSERASRVLTAETESNSAKTLLIASRHVIHRLSVLKDVFKQPVSERGKKCVLGLDCSLEVAHSKRQDEVHPSLGRVVGQQRSDLEIPVCFNLQ